MGRNQDRQRIASQINAAADIYRQKLVGRRFMYVFDNRSIEVIYKAENFKHLTGVDSPLSAKQFYRLACRGHLTGEQIGFSSAHPYDLCVRKVVHIGQLAVLATNESFMLEEITTRTQFYKFGTTDLHFSVCMNKRAGDCYVAESLRDEDCFSRSKGVFAVTHIFSRQNDAKRYTHVHYLEQGYIHGQLPQEIRETLSSDLLGQLGL